MEGGLSQQESDSEITEVGSVQTFNKKTYTNLPSNSKMVEYSQLKDVINQLRYLPEDIEILSINCHDKASQQYVS